MGGIALLLAEPGATPDARTLGAMVAAAPHRGDSVETLIHGRCGLAVSTSADLHDTAIGRQRRPRGRAGRIARQRGEPRTRSWQASAIRSPR